MLPDSYLDALCASQLTSSTNSRPYSLDLNSCISSELGRKGLFVGCAKDKRQRATGKGQGQKKKLGFANSCSHDNLEGGRDGTNPL